MLRTTICAVAAMALAVTATAGEYADVNGTFRVTVPDDWTTHTAPVAGIALVTASPRLKETGGNCNFAVLEIEQTKSMTQAQVESEFATTFTEEAWKAEISQIKGLKSTTVEDLGNKTQRGRKVFFVTATSEFVIGATTLAVKQLQDFHPIPGRVYVVTCTALSAGYEQEAANFAGIMTSFEPIPYMTVSANHTLAPSLPGQGVAMTRTAAKAAAVSVEAGALRSRAR